ncbi:hypothetical protein F383_17999 [Gossypium arboreum]|uniref:NERD domain-containing protein n=1 Tax=Gossypium arboreum TaxID=29729 RepID=A0A0B0NPT8_GOSAR|nr:hypothetical protein F383_17999 [Gossypium arboreum]
MVFDHVLRHKKGLWLM